MSNLSKLALPLDIRGVSVRNRVFLAPMSGVTDLPMRELAWRHGAGLVVAEMVPGAELANGKEESARRIRKTSARPHMIQLAGRQPKLMADGAKVAEDEGADIIDINMGCPAKKVTGGYCGSALMRDPDLAVRIVEAVVSAVKVPVTVKMRLGWDEAHLNASDLARRAEMAGASMITVHGRTRCQFYKGKADWDAIAGVKAAVRIPVVANGDGASRADLEEMVSRSGADAVMIGRAHYGAPWLAGSFAKAAGCRHARTWDPPDNLAEYVAAHYEQMLTLYGSARGIRHARKHLGWYYNRFAGTERQELRNGLMTALDPDSVFSSIREIFVSRGAINDIGIAI